MGRQGGRKRGWAENRPLDLQSASGWVRLRFKVVNSNMNKGYVRSRQGRLLTKTVYSEKELKKVLIRW
jgi:hypothetical protein